MTDSIYSSFGSNQQPLLAKQFSRSQHNFSHNAQCHSHLESQHLWLHEVEWPSINFHQASASLAVCNSRRSFLHMSIAHTQRRMKNNNCLLSAITTKHYKMSNSKESSILQNAKSTCNASAEAITCRFTTSRNV